jgi:hypothetical protein
MAAISLLMSSCEDFLKEDPKSTRPYDEFWQSKADVESAVNGLYLVGVPKLYDTDVDGDWTPTAPMWGGIMSGLFVDKRKDRTFTSASENCNFNIASFDGIALKLWRELYKGVSQANFVIAGVDKVYNDTVLNKDNKILTEKERDNFIAQAKFFRAYNYFHLVKEFNYVPYVDKPYTTADNSMYKLQSNPSEVYEKIEADLLDAIAVLPEKAFYGYGYATKAMARTVLAQAYLQWAGNPVNNATKYTLAAAQADSVISVAEKSGIYGLEPKGEGLNSAFNVIKTSKTSKEIIYAKEYDHTDRNYNMGHNYAFRSIETEAYQWGIFPSHKDVLYNAYLPDSLLLNSYDTSDIRGQEKQFFFSTYVHNQKDTFSLNNAGNWLWFDEDALLGGRPSNNNLPIIRYSEVLLIAAEGHLLSKEQKTTNKTREYLNKVRNRAGLDSIQESVSSTDTLRALILTERFHEFPLEFKIWDDIRRTRLYPQATGVKGTLDWKPLSEAFIPNKPEGKSKQGALGDWENHMLLLPIPGKEMDAYPKGTKLVQNPGWN